MNALVERAKELKEKNDFLETQIIVHKDEKKVIIVSSRVDSVLVYWNIVGRRIIIAPLPHLNWVHSIEVFPVSTFHP
jgi:hypothetical protein